MLLGWIFVQFKENYIHYDSIRRSNIYIQFQGMTESRIWEGHFWSKSSSKCMFLILFLNEFKVSNCLTLIYRLDYNTEPKWLALFSKTNIVESCDSAQQQMAFTKVFVLNHSYIRVLDIFNAILKYA